MLLFPQRLHKVLDEAKYESIISWQPHGRSFKVHKREEFVRVVLPLFAKSGRTYASFQRQLNYYGFQRYDLSGPDKGSYHHPHFLRGCFDLCKDYMSRRQSVLAKKSVQNGNGNIFELNKGYSPLLPTAVANTIPFTSSRGIQLNGTTSPTVWLGIGKDPKELIVPRPPYCDHNHSAKSCATHRFHHYEREPQLQNENGTVPSLEREIHPPDIFTQIAHRSREYDHYPQDAQLYNRPPSWATERKTYNSSQLQPKSYGGDEEFQGISCNHNHYYEDQRQESGEGLKGYRGVSTQRRIENDTIRLISPYEENFDNTNFNYGYSTTADVEKSRSFSRSSVYPHCNCVSQNENQYRRQGGTQFRDSFYAIEKRHRENAFRSSHHICRASVSRDCQFSNSSERRQGPYDSFHDLALHESDTFSSIEKQLSEEIEPVPEKDILNILNNNSLKAAESYEQDLMQSSFSFS